MSTPNPQALALAAEALAAMPDMAEAVPAGVLVAAGADPIELSHLQVTPNAVPTLKEISQWSERKYKRSEVIDYQPSAVTNGQQVMWLPVSEIPLLSTLTSRSADLASLQPFEPNTTPLESVLLIAVCMEHSGSSTVFIQGVQTRHILATTSKMESFLSEGGLNKPIPIRWR